MRFPLFALAFASAVTTSAAKEHIVRVTWDTAGDYRAALAVPAGKFREACADLAAGERIRWSFRADGETAFNIHFHEGEKVVYPTKKDGVRHDEGVLEVRTSQAYCWMWRTTDRPARVDVSLERMDAALK